MAKDPRTGPKIQGPPKIERVMHIARIMAAGKWKTRITELELMDQWGVKLSLVRSDADEASRLLKMDQKELDALREQNRTFLERLAHDAIERRSTVTGLPDYKAALEATRMTYEYVLGVNPRKQQVEVDASALSDDELLRLARVATKVIGETLEERKKAADEAPVQDQGPQGG